VFPYPVWRSNFGFGKSILQGVTPGKGPKKEGEQIFAVMFFAVMFFVAFFGQSPTFPSTFSQVL
jgi:hypothetical protein